MRKRILARHYRKLVSASQKHHVRNSPTNYSNFMPFQDLGLIPCLSRPEKCVVLNSMTFQDLYEPCSWLAILFLQLICYSLQSNQFSYASISFLVSLCIIYVSIKRVTTSTTIDTSNCYPLTLNLLYGAKKKAANKINLHMAADDQ